MTKPKQDTAVFVYITLIYANLISENDKLIFYINKINVSL